VAEFQSLTLFLITVVVSTVYILGKFVDHQEAALKANDYMGSGRSKINSHPQTEIINQQSVNIVDQELRDRRLVNKAVKEILALQNKNSLEEMEVYDVKTGQKIKYYKENS
jgi:hypothetical protein